MKKRIFLISLICILTSGLCGGLAEGGTSADPVVSLSYITNTYIPDFKARADERISVSLGLVYNDAFASLAVESGSYNAALAAADASLQACDGQKGFKLGDFISGTSGLQLRLDSGSALLVNTGGTLVDMSTGAAADGTQAVAGRTYMVTGDTGSGMTITSDVATVTLSGSYTLDYSESVDYTSFADALNTMGLFKGRTDGYALCCGATRAEGIVMFLRLIGEESQALSYTGEQPFSDASWADRYIAYAYAKGYTKGVSSTLFGTNEPLTAAHYVTFLLRALDYTENEDFAWKTVMTDVVSSRRFSECRSYKARDHIHAGAGRLPLLLGALRNAQRPERQHPHIADQ